jgi:hypothetical protein
VNYVNCHLWGVSYVGLIHFYEYFSFCHGVLVSLCLLCNVWLVFFFLVYGVSILFVVFCSSYVMCLGLAHLIFLILVVFLH